MDAREAGGRDGGYWRYIRQMVTKCCGGDGQLSILIYVIYGQ